MTEHPVRSPVFRQFHGRPEQIPLVLFELLVEAVEQGEGIGGRTGKPDDHLIVIEPAYLSRPVFHDRRIEGHLAVARHGDLSPVSHRQDGRSPDLHRLRLPSSGPRVGPVIDLHETAHTDRRVFLRRRKALMAEHLLDGTEIGARIEQVRREGVTQRMGADLPADTALADHPFHDPGDAARIHPRSPCAEEKRVIGAMLPSLGRKFPASFQIRFDGRERRPLRPARSVPSAPFRGP